VTNAKAWESYHQYGLAVDFVLRLGNQWSWDTSGTLKRHWQRLHELGREVGLEPLSWELPHLQVARLKSCRSCRGESTPMVGMIVVGQCRGGGCRMARLPGSTGPDILATRGPEVDT
jgi:hypothetical protein